MRIFPRKTKPSERLVSIFLDADHSRLYGSFWIDAKTRKNEFSICKIYTYNHSFSGGTQTSKNFTNMTTSTLVVEDGTACISLTSYDFDADLPDAYKNVSSIINTLTLNDGVWFVDNKTVVYPVFGHGTHSHSTKTFKGFGVDSEAKNENPEDIVNSMTFYHSSDNAAWDEMVTEKPSAMVHLGTRRAALDRALYHIHMIEDGVTDYNEGHIYEVSLKGLSLYPHVVFDRGLMWENFEGDFLQGYNACVYRNRGEDIGSYSLYVRAGNVAAHKVESLTDKEIIATGKMFA